MVLVLLALFSWPFLKLRFIGEAQRVKAHDVVLVGIGALLTIALITVSTLDLYALSGGSRPFSTINCIALPGRSSPKRNRRYQRPTRSCRTSGPASPTPSLARRRWATLGTAMSQPAKTSFSILSSESLAFLDKSGGQRQKLTFDSFVTPLIDTSTREYCGYWQSSRSQPAFLQPLQSATTGSREAVLSAPVLDHDVFRVAAMTIPMHALIDPVIPPWFGFAVISLEGQVLFRLVPTTTFPKTSLSRQTAAAA